jgi:hypothetical protein
MAAGAPRQKAECATQALPFWEALDTLRTPLNPGGSLARRLGRGDRNGGGVFGFLPPPLCIQERAFVPR